MSLSIANRLGQVKGAGGSPQQDYINLVNQFISDKSISNATYLPMNDSGGTAVNAANPGTRDQSILGATLGSANGPFGGNILYFDGVNDRIVMDASFLSTVSSKGTIGAWGYADWAGGSPNMYLYDMVGGGSGHHVGVFRSTVAYRTDLRLYDGTYRENRWNPSGGDRWLQAVISWELGVATRIWRNGAIVYNGAMASSWNVPTIVNIGRRYDGTRYLNGDIGHFFYFPEYRCSNDDITTLYNGGPV